MGLSIHHSNRKKKKIDRVCLVLVGQGGYRRKKSKARGEDHLDGNGGVVHSGTGACVETGNQTPADDSTSSVLDWDIQRGVRITDECRRGRAAA